MHDGKPLRVCWIGNPRYAHPLNPTDDKKWHLLTQLGIEMDVIAFAEGVRPRHFTQHAHFYLLPALPISVLRYAEMFLLSPFIALWLIFRHDTRVIIAQSPFEGAIGALAKNIARLFGRKIALVVENHGDFEVSVFTQRKVTFSGVYRRLMNLSARYAFRHADVLRAISSMTERQLQAHAPGLPIHRFMTWTDSSVFRDTPRSIPLSQTHDIIYTGVLIPRKGVHFLIDAFARLVSEFPHASLGLIGKAENLEYEAQLVQQVERHGLMAHVSFIGAVSQQELAFYMGCGRVLVLPSISEGLGRVLVEAMLCGTPAVGSNVDGIPDVIQDGVNGYLVPAGDVDALTARLGDILRDTNIEAMGQRARAFAEKFFSEQAYLDGYRGLLEAAESAYR